MSRRATGITCLFLVAGVLARLPLRKEGLRGRGHHDLILVQIALRDVSGIAPAAQVDGVQLRFLPGTGFHLADELAALLGDTNSGNRRHVLSKRLHVESDAARDVDDAQRWLRQLHAASPGSEERLEDITKS
jgi:hypothetical protein